MFQYNADNGIKTNLSREIIFLVTLINFNVTRRTSAKQKSQCKNASSLVGITMHTNLPTDTMHSSLKKNHQWNVKPVEESLARVPTKRIAPARYSRSRVVLAFFCKSMSNRQTARHRSSRFFQNAFHSAIAAVARRLPPGRRQREDHVRHEGRQGAGQGRQRRSAVARYPSGHIMHRGQPKGNLADAVKTVVLYAYTFCYGGGGGGVYARPDPTVRIHRYVWYRTGGDG